MADVNLVTLNTSSYNSIKAENFRGNLFLENLLANAKLSADRQHLVFDSDDVENALKFCYLETYKKKVATLKTQTRKYGGDLVDEPIEEENKNGELSRYEKAESRR